MYFDYNLPRFHPLTYSGQKEMCHLFDVKLMNPIICCRNEHPYSNLRDYFPSKTLHIPGDGTVYSLPLHITRLEILILITEFGH